MSIRRKASIAIKNEEAPQGGSAQVAPTRKKRSASSVKDLRAESSTSPTKPPTTNSRSQPTLKLQSSDKLPLKDAPMIDIDLEELLKFETIFTKEAPVEQNEEDASNRVEKAKECLGRLETEIIEALFPAQGSPEPLEDIAKRLGMTQKEVREVADNALRGLRGTKSSRGRLSTVWN